MAFGRTLPPWFGRQVAPPVDPSIMGMLPQAGQSEAQFTAGAQIAPVAAGAQAKPIDIGLSREEVAQRRAMADRMGQGNFPLSQVQDPWTAAAYALENIGSAWTEKRAKDAEEKQKSADRKALADALNSTDPQAALSKLDIPDVQDWMAQAKIKEMSTPRATPEDVDGDGKPDGVRLPDGTLKIDPRTAAQEDAARLNYYRQTTGADAAAGRANSVRLAQMSGDRAAQQLARKPMTDEQTKALGFAKRIEDANKILEDPGRQAALLSSAQNAGASVPGLSNQLVSSDYQEADQAVREFINAQLRRESGAVIADSEFENARAQYIPRWGDQPKVLARKRDARRRALENLYVSSGPTGAERAAQVAGTTNFPPPNEGGWKIEEVK